MKRVFALTLAALVVGFAHGQVKPDPFLSSFAIRLEKLLGSRHIRPTRTFSEPGTLVMTYRTSLFQVMAHTMGGPDPHKTYSMIGPLDDGIMIRAEVYNRDPNAPLTPSQGQYNPPFREIYADGYWLYDFDRRQIVGQNRALQYTISWGKDFDPKLLKNVRSELDKGTEVVRGEISWPGVEPPKGIPPP